MIDKAQSFSGLLATCALQLNPVTSNIGDQELFWLGFETVKENYIFNPSYPGAIGKSNRIGEKSQICSNEILHVVDNKPFWIKGAINIAGAKEWAIEPGFWEIDETSICISTKETNVILPALENILIDTSRMIKSERFQK